MRAKYKMADSTPKLVFKCRKCRGFLFEQNDGSKNSEYELENLGVWYIPEENLPDLIKTVVNEAGWLKGKLNCPKCAGRLGSFDFINKVSHPVHLNKSKVDREINGIVSEKPEEISPNLALPAK